MDKSPQLVAFDDVLHKPYDKWESTIEAIDMFMYPVTEKFMIAFPNMASYMSRKHIKGRDSARFWNCVCGDKYGYSKQKWQMHKKPTPVGKEKKDKKNILTDEDIIYGYSKVYDYDIESVRFAIKNYPEEMKEELLSYKTDFVDNNQTKQKEQGDE